MAQRVCDIRCLIEFVVSLSCWYQLPRWAVEIRCLIQVVIIVVSLSCWLLLSRAVLGIWCLIQFVTFDALVSSWERRHTLEAVDSAAFRQRQFLIFVPWLIYTCSVTHLHVWLPNWWSRTIDVLFSTLQPLSALADSFLCVTTLISTCDMPHEWIGSRTSDTVLLTLQHLSTFADSLTCVTWLICLCDMTHLYVWHDSRMNGVTNDRRISLDSTAPFRLRRLLYMFDMIHLHVWHDSFACVTWLIYMCDMTHEWMGSRTTGALLSTVQPLSAFADFFTCVTWLIYMRDMIHLHVWHDSFTCVTWFIYMCDMPHVRHDSTTCVTWLIYRCVPWLTNTWGHEPQARSSWLYRLFPPSLIPSYLWHDSHV